MYTSCMHCTVFTMYPIDASVLVLTYVPHNFFPSSLLYNCMSHQHGYNQHHSDMYMDCYNFDHKNHQDTLKDER